MTEDTDTMEQSLSSPLPRLTSRQKWAFLLLLPPWVLHLLATWARPDLMWPYVSSRFGCFALVGCFFLTGAQALLLFAAFRRRNRTAAEGRALWLVRGMIFAVALVQIAEILVVLFGPIAWVFLQRPPK